MLLSSKSSAIAPQKQCYCAVKAMLLRCKSTEFETQKEGNDLATIDN